MERFTPQDNASSSAGRVQPVSTNNYDAFSPASTASTATNMYESTGTPRTAHFPRLSSASETAPSHGRSMSNMSSISGMDTSRKGKRFSLTFPINATSTAASSTPSPTRSTPPSSLSESILSPTGPTDASFLTAVATQERRVLELKEELHKAEGELKRLKQEWALHEAQRKRHDARRLQKLQPLNTTITPSYHSLEDDPDGSSAWMQQEMERRKALLNGTKPSNRTVFSGSRHARTLSLLSPNSNLSSGKLAATRDFDVRSRSPTMPERPRHPLRIPTDEALTGEVADNADINIDLGIPRDVLMKTGKQMATDFRDGLWTFIEDLRQATVGDEGINGTTTRTQSQLDQKGLRQQPSRGSLRPPARPQPIKRSSTTSSKRGLTPSPARSNTRDDSALLDLGGSFWQENGIEEPKVVVRPTVQKAAKKKPETMQKPSQVPDDSADSWDNWDSPEAVSKVGRSNSDTSVSDNQTSPSPNGTSPRTSVR